MDVKQQWHLHRETGVMRPETPDVKAWFDGQWDEAICHKALRGVYLWMQQTYGKEANLTKTPAGTGMGLLALTLPLTKDKRRIDYPVLPDGILASIHSNSYPHRWQTFSRDTGVEYDARSAFVGCCRHVPCWFGGEIQYDNKDAYVPYHPARYLVDVTVPKGWISIGLVPFMYLEGERYRQYPATPGESWQVWLDGYEVQLLQEHSWPHTIKQRLLFADRDAPGADPLRAWNQPIIDMLQKIETHPRWGEPDIAAIRYAIRAICLQTLGTFHRRPGEVVNVDPDTGDVTVEEIKLNNFTKRYHHPEWSAAIWARCRVKTTKQALIAQMQYGRKILAIHGDAIVLDAPIPDWQDTGKVGAYRLKTAVSTHG